MYVPGHAHQEAVVAAQRLLEDHPQFLFTNETKTRNETRSQSEQQKRKRKNDEECDAYEDGVEHGRRNTAHEEHQSVARSAQLAKNEAARPRHVLRGHLEDLWAR
jgi:hypothetical protein